MKGFRWRECMRGESLISNLLPPLLIPCGRVPGPCSTSEMLTEPQAKTPITELTPGLKTITCLSAESLMKNFMSKMTI